MSLSPQKSIYAGAMVSSRNASKPAQVHSKLLSTSQLPRLRNPRGYSKQAQAPPNGPSLKLRDDHSQPCLQSVLHRKGYSSTKNANSLSQLPPDSKLNRVATNQVINNNFSSQLSLANTAKKPDTAIGGIRVRHLKVPSRAGSASEKKIPVTEHKSKHHIAIPGPTVASSSNFNFVATEKKSVPGKSPTKHLM